MVDQGQKGYCAAATSERLLRYYGTQVDQNVIAQVANTSASLGTNPEAMIDTMKKLGLKFGVKVSVHYEFTVKKFMAFVADYNRAAQKARANQVTLDRLIDISAIYKGMDFALMKDARCERDGAGFKNFQSDIFKYVDLGVPLAWSVCLGKVKEMPELPQAAGGHMRIIQGYNKATKAIVYSDSWGAGHEKKTMPMDDAWTITTGLYTFDPR